MALSALALVSALTLAGANNKIAVLDIQLRAGGDDVLAKSLTDAAVAEARKALGAKAVVGIDDIRQLTRYIDEKRKIGCLEVGCLAEIGGALGVDKILSGTLGKVGDQYVLVFKLIDVRKAEVLAEESRDATGENQLLSSLRDALHHIFDPQPIPQAARVPPAEVTVKPADHSHALAFALGGIALATAAFCVVGIVEYAQPYDPHNQSSVDSSNGWGYAALATGIVALGTGTGAVLTW